MNRKVLLQALRTAWGADRRGTTTAAALQLLGAASGFGVVLASKLALNSVLSDEGRVSGGLVLGLALLALATAVSASVGVLQGQQQRLLAEKVGQHVWRLLLRACIAVDLVTWESNAFVDRLDRVRFNALQRPTDVVSGLLGLAGSAVGVLSMVVLLVGIDPLLIPALVVAGVPTIFFSRLSSRAEFTFIESSNAVFRQRAYLKRVTTSREFAAEVRAFESGPHFLAEHDRADADYLDLLVPHTARRQRLGLLATLVSALALAATLLIIVLLVQSGRITLAEAGAAALAARILGGQLTTVYTSIGSLIEAGPFLVDLQQFLDETPDLESRGRARRLEVGLVLSSVSFSYEGRDRPAVDDVSIVIPPGRVIAVVGENGSGKTTMAKIVAGLFAPQQGAVLWDGDEQIALRDLRASVSALFQDFVRYQLSGGENITIANTAAPADRERARRAARQMGVDAVLSSLPHGYDTVLGMEVAKGSDLSGGQWQRLALARAVYRDAPVIVLDEPTAAMDPRGEHELFSDVRNLLQGRSALLISHRYSSVRLADYIYVMAEGRVVEEGTHDDLVALAGQYAELYALQAAAYGVSEHHSGARPGEHHVTVDGERQT